MKLMTVLRGGITKKYCHNIVTKMSQDCLIRNLQCKGVGKGLPDLAIANPW